MTKAAYLIPFLFVPLFSACDKGATAIIKEPIPVDKVEKIAEMNQVLGWNIFKQEQLAKPGQNVLISPFSIQTALTMATNGAQGVTLGEMLSLMGCENCAVNDLNPLHRDLTQLLSKQSGSPTLTVANRYFHDAARINVKPPFLDALSAHYSCGDQKLNFDNEQAALDQINNWVKNSTNGKIPQILERITALDVAFLINAIHFKADWATGFAPQLTTQKAFTKADGSQTQVDFVNADRDFTFAQTALFNLVDIPFKDSTFSVSFIQPTTANTDANWHLNITPSSWKGMYEAAQYGRAMVFFPKLKLAYDNDLIQSLKHLGMKAAFSDRDADFTLMGTAVKNIFINQIKHKAVLEIDEKGAEGAAVTSIGFGITSVPPTFWFNRPFVLVLRHIPTNTMVFVSYVADPS
ncbi:MAG: serpin family protein [Saprospiraceae bacterium]|nr:serpin family protein [Saprospiraceae bacterium]